MNTQKTEQVQELSLGALFNLVHQSLSRKVYYLQMLIKLKKSLQNMCNCNRTTLFASTQTLLQLVLMIITSQLLQMVTTSPLQIMTISQLLHMMTSNQLLLMMTTSQLLSYDDY